MGAALSPPLIFIVSQRELGIATGYSESQISRLERGLRRPGLEAVQALFAPALGLAAGPG